MTAPISHVNDTVERLAALAAGIAGIATVYPYTPADPASAQCPFIVVEVSPSNPTEFHATGGRQYVESKYKLAVCNSRWEADSTLAINVQAAWGWRDLVFAMFAQHLRLSPLATPNQPDLDWVVDAVIKRWGAERYPLGSTDFAALTFDVIVKESLVLSITG